MTDPETRGLHLHLEGRVQGVGFRAFTRRHARNLGVGGWVKNLPDGRVEIQAVGDPEDLQELESRIRKGPPAGRVRSVDKEELSDPPDFTDFEVRF